MGEGSGLGDRYRSVGGENVDPARVYLVDDHPLIRQGLAGLIAQEADLEVCGQACSADEAVSAILASKPDVVVLDLKLRESSGLDVIQEVHRRMPDIRVLVCSVYDEPSFVERAFRMGASGYVSKQEAGQQVLKAIRNVHQGGMYVSPKLRDEVLSTFLHGQGGANEDPLDKLSDREAQVFQLMGEGLRIRDIAERLCLSHRTIETYRDGIKNKLNLDSSHEVVRRATQWSMDRG